MLNMSEMRHSWALSFSSRFCLRRPVRTAQLFTSLIGELLYLARGVSPGFDVAGQTRYDPGLNRTYAEMAEHYGTAILPARVRKPKDKAKVEVAVQVAQRWILARLRNQRFFSLASELNAAIRPLPDALNMLVMRDYGASRADLFATLDRPNLAGSTAMKIC